MSEDKQILDACCGSRMFWFNPENPNAIFADRRREEHKLKDRTSTGGERTLIVDPDILCDFRALPFECGRFSLVVFDPPHLVKVGKSGWLAKKYGNLEGDWRSDIRMGFSECFRVLKESGVLIFKWNETDIPVSDILKLCSQSPLFGNRSGKRSKSHWIVFMKGATP